MNSDIEAYAASAVALVNEMARAGYVLTVEQESYPPLAMGRYRTRILVRPARNPADPPVLTHEEST
jgi:hypothetical protein